MGTNDFRVSDMGADGAVTSGAHAPAVAYGAGQYLVVWTGDNGAPLADDEFDTVGLGERRSMEDYGPDGPRRLRGAAIAAEATPVVSPALPMWLVILVIVAAIGGGVFMAMVR